MLRNKPLKSQRLILPRITYARNCIGSWRLADTARPGWAVLWLLAKLGSCRQGLAGCDCIGLVTFFSQDLQTNLGTFPHGYCRGTREQVDTEGLLLAKLGTDTSSIDQSKSQGQTKVRRRRRKAPPPEKGRSQGPVQKEL